MMSDYTDPWRSVFMGASNLDSDETSNPKPMDTFSEFGDDSCGEPLVAQHIHIDFTPNDDDNAIVQKKVCAFWQFINNQPNIQNLKVTSGKCEAHAKPSKTKVVTPEEEVAENRNKTACEMLDMFDKKDLLIRAVFHGRRPCDLVSIKEDEDIQQKNRSYQTPIFWTGTMHKHPARPVKKPAPSKAKKLCTKLQEWDDKHPKSMDPPGHAPSLQPCVVQKQVFEF